MKYTTRSWHWIPLGLLLFFLYAGVAAVTLGVNPFKGQTITPFDVLVSQRAWAFAAPPGKVEIRNYERSDILNSRLPQWETAKLQIRDGYMPLWNDKIAGGGTFLTVNTNIFTPAFAIFAAIPDSALGFYLAMLANLAIAGLGMHLFLRRHVGWLAAMAAAMTFELCGFNAAWLYWPHVFTLIWMPWLLLSIDRCAENPGIRGSLMIAVTSALVCLGGFPFVSVLVLEACGLYAIVRWAFLWRCRTGHIRFCCWYASGSALGLLLAALPLLGLVFWLQQFDIGYRYGRGSYLNIHHWKQLFPPWAWQVQRVEQTMYVGAVMMGFAIAAVVGIIVRWRRVSPLALFAALLLVASAGLVFGLWPMWLIGWLPGMAFNSWSRAIGVMDIALVTLGALCIDRLWHAGHDRRRRLLRAVLIAAVLMQTVEMSMFFRGYNGAVDARTYFPQTPSIEYMRKHAGPFDYVITDKSFLMSGTLGVYGLREWLAHYFRSPALQDALHKMAGHPFNSHAASPSRFPASDVKYDSPAMATYNVRYVAIDSRSSPDSPISIAPPEKGKHVALPAMPEHRYSQGFTIKTKADFVGIAVRMATYRQKNLPGQVTLRLHDASSQALAEVTLTAAGISDNTFVNFDFSKPISLDAGRYRFSLDYDTTRAPAPRLTSWSFPISRESNLRVDDKPANAVIEYQLREKTPGNNHFKRVFSDAGTAVFENDASPNGPYFLSDIAQQPDTQSGQSIKVEAYRPAHFKLHYEGPSPGYVVVPMSFNNDWRVTVNGAPQHPAVKDGVLPAVKVNGPATIDFSYAPRALRYLYPWLAALIAALAIMTAADRWTRLPTPPTPDASP